MLRDEERQDIKDAIVLWTVPLWGLPWLFIVLLIGLVRGFVEWDRSFRQMEAIERHVLDHDRLREVHEQEIRPSFLDAD